MMERTTSPIAPTTATYMDELGRAVRVQRGPFPALATSARTLFSTAAGKLGGASASPVGTLALRRLPCHHRSRRRQMSPGFAAQVITLNHHYILVDLRTLGSEAEQRGLWLGEGTQTDGEMCSFVEACCGLFDDSALGEKLYSSGTEFGPDVDAALREIDKLTDAIDDDRPQEEIIADPVMAKMRQVASDAFRRIMSMGGRNRQRIIDRLLEWRDVDVRRRLWFPSGDGIEAESSPRNAQWALFRGKDCWMYLDLGRREREFSPLFFELDKRISRLDYDRRPLEDVLSDPLMMYVGQMAARIIEKLETSVRDIP